MDLRSRLSDLWLLNPVFLETAESHLAESG